MCREPKESINSCDSESNDYESDSISIDNGAIKDSSVDAMAIECSTANLPNAIVQVLMLISRNKLMCHRQLLYFHPSICKV